MAKIDVRKSMRPDSRRLPFAEVSDNPKRRKSGYRSLPFNDGTRERETVTTMDKPWAGNSTPFMPEFIAEGRKFPRIDRETGDLRVRTDNGHQVTHTTWNEEKRAERAAARLDQVHMRRDENAVRKHKANAGAVLKDRINAALERERCALAVGDVAAAEAARAEVRVYRKAARASV